MSDVLGITGASGYIGQAVMRAAQARGWRVVAIGRRPIAGAESWRHADLARTPAENVLDGLDCVLHLAANTQGDDTSAAAELAFACGLAQQAAEAHIPMVFVSSQAAAADAPTQYGRSKYAIEQSIAPLGALTIRPGLVVGGRAAGLFGMLITLVRVLPLLPDLRPPPLVQPIHVDDLAAVLLTACERPVHACRTLSAAGDPVELIDVLSGIARQWLRLRRLRLPLPLPLLRLALTVGAPMLGTRLSPARLDSLIRLPLLDARADLAMLGVTLRPLSDALGRGGRGTRRLLLEEGYALARAITATKPPVTLLRRYVRLLQILGQSHALPLSHVLIARPILLAALDTPTKRRIGKVPGGLIWRMNVVLRLAEAEPSLASLFLMTPRRSGKFYALRDIVCAGTRAGQLGLIAPIARFLARGVS